MDYSLEYSHWYLQTISANCVLVLYPCGAPVVILLFVCTYVRIGVPPNGLFRLLPLVRVKAYITFGMSASGPHVSTRLPLAADLQSNLTLQTYMKSCREKSNFVKIGQKSRPIYMKT